MEADPFSISLTSIDINQLFFVFFCFFCSFVASFLGRFLYLQLKKHLHLVVGGTKNKQYTPHVLKAGRQAPTNSPPESFRAGSYASIPKAKASCGSCRQISVGRLRHHNEATQNLSDH